MADSHPDAGYPAANLNPALRPQRPHSECFGESPFSDGLCI
ncbi:Uncharacterised protein [Kingella potus]|uniref:Uncharacterized protein n=1 Tax=Kingella potus TaxID=265175 RepID=A0A377R6H0_9NEIS|nr:Uncharacterised protein [Kingella potus]